MKAFYLVMAIVGAAIPWYYNLRAINEMGDEFTPVNFFLAGFQGSPMLGSVAADFWIGSLVSIVWMVAEGRRLGMKYWWVFIVLTLMIAWACALPLFLYFRQRRLDCSAEPASTAAD